MVEGNFHIITKTAIYTTHASKWFWHTKKHVECKSGGGQEHKHHVFAAYGNPWKREICVSKYVSHLCQFKISKLYFVENLILEMIWMSRVEEENLTMKEEKKTRRRSINWEMKIDWKHYFNFFETNDAQRFANWQNETKTRRIKKRIKILHQR